jgi:DNA-directed RNA polymerase beta' subunit
MFIFLSAGCKIVSVDDPIKNDLLVYVDSVSEAMILEEDALKYYRSVADDKYEKDNTDIVIKKIVIPKYTEFVDKLENIKPQTEEVKKLHKIYTKVANTRLKAFEQMKEGFEKKDGKLVKETDKILAEAKSSVEEYKRQLIKLTEEHNIKLNIK